MPLNETFTEIIAKLTQRIDELKAQIGEVDTRSTTAYNTSVSLADAIAKQKKELEAQKQELEAQKQEINNLKETRSVTTTTPPTADGTGLPAFVVLDTKPETEYKNYVYIYPRG